jgi:hypothetical protein
MKIITTLFCIAFSGIAFAQIPNASFETWNGGNPTQWTTGNSIAAGSATQSSDAYSGNYAVSLNSISGIGGFVETGDGVDGYFLNSGNPVALNGWYILNSVGGDEFVVLLSTKCPTVSSNGSTNSKYLTSTAVYKEFFACITYNNSCTADSASILLSLTNPSGDGSTHSGSYVIIDDLSWGACTTGVDDIKNTVDLEPSYPNPASDVCNIIYSIPNTATVSVSLYDVSGRKVMDILNNANQTTGRYKIPLDVRTLANGVYIYTITVDGVPYSQKLAVAK